MANKLLILVFALSSLIPCYAQKNKRIFFGLNYCGGFSYNSDYYKKSTNSEVTSLFPSGAGGYSITVLNRKDSVKKMVDFFKFNINLSLRGGYFEAGAANVLKIHSSCIDFDILIPMRFKFAGNLDSYIGIGPSFGFLLEQSATWIKGSGSVERKKIQPGYVGEIGLIGEKFSAIGLRFFGNFTHYSVSEVSFFCVFTYESVKAAKLSKKNRY